IIVCVVEARTGTVGAMLSHLGRVIGRVIHAGAADAAPVLPACRDTRGALGDFGGGNMLPSRLMPRRVILPRTAPRPMPKRSAMSVPDLPAAHRARTCSTRSGVHSQVMSPPRRGRDALCQSGESEKCGER